MAATDHSICVSLGPFAFALTQPSVKAEDHHLSIAVYNLPLRSHGCCTNGSGLLVGVEPPPQKKKRKASVVAVNSGVIIIIFFLL